MFTKGTDRIIYIDINGTFIPVGCLTSDSFSEEVDFINTTTRQNNGWETYRPVTQRFSVQFDGLIVEEVENNVSYGSLVQIKRNRELKNFRMMTVNGIHSHEFKAYIQSIGDAASVGEFLTFSVSLTGWGEPFFSGVFEEHFDYNFDFNLA